MKQPTLREKIGHGARFITPLAYRLRRVTRNMMRRALRRPRTVAEGPNLLPLLIQVLAAFSKVEGKVVEEEVDSILGFLRHDYPEAVYSELRKLYRQALNEQQDPRQHGAEALGTVDHRAQDHARRATLRFDFQGEGSRNRRW